MEQKRALGGFIRRLGFKIAPPADSPYPGCGWMKHDARQHRTHGMHLELEGSDYAKVAAASAYCPKKIVILASAGRYQAAVGKYHFRGEQVVKSETMFAHEPTESAAEGKAGNARD
jgi:hypothetical protein